MCGNSLISNHMITYAPRGSIAPLGFTCRAPPLSTRTGPTRAPIVSPSLPLDLLSYYYYYSSGHFLPVNHPSVSQVAELSQVNYYLCSTG